MSNREKEIEVVLNTIVAALDIHNLTLTVDFEKEALIVVDAITGKRYGIQQVKGGSNE